MHVEQSAFHQLYRYNFSANATNVRNNIHTLTEMSPRCYIGPNPDKVRLDTTGSNKTVLMCGNIMVDPLCIGNGADITEEYLNTPIAGKDVYGPLFGSGQYLYTGHEYRYKVVEPGQRPESVETPYRKICFTTEQTIADLYRHNWYYSYNPESDTFLELPEEGRLNNLLRYRCQVAVLQLAGTPEDRLADYGRVIAFLLSKVTLTEQEQIILEPFLAQVPGTSVLAAIADKEGRIRNVVASVHANPTQHLAEVYNTYHRDIETTPEIVEEQ